MILLIDNYDSFTFNLVQYIAGFDADIHVIRNDLYSIEEIEAMKPDAIVISPGPGKPSEAGICIEAIRHFTGTLPILGVCLGHQAICEAFGATVSYAKELMHGKVSMTNLDKDCPLFKGINSPTPVARYHSLAALEDTMPECLSITARTADGEIMAVKHKEADVYGVQFHPESVMTTEGLKMIENFISIIK